MKYLKTFEGLFETDNRIKKHEKLLIDSVIEFMKNELNFDANIIVRKKESTTLIGDISLNHNSITKNKFTLHYNPNQSIRMQIRALIHELTHVKQVSKKELTTIDYKSIIWKDGFEIPVKDYNKTMKNIKDYIELPWEKEAYGSGYLVDKYLESNYFLKLKGKDVVLDQIIDYI
jgi:hypothetical protein